MSSTEYTVLCLAEEISKMANHVEVFSHRNNECMLEFALQSWHIKVRVYTNWNARMWAEPTCQDPDKGGNGEKVVLEETQQEAPGLWL